MTSNIKQRESANGPLKRERHAAKYIPRLLPDPIRVGTGDLRGVDIVARLFRICERLCPDVFHRVVHLADLGAQDPISLRMPACRRGLRLSLPVDQHKVVGQRLDLDGLP